MASRVTKRTLASELGQLLSQGRRRSWYAAARRLEAAGESVYGWQLLHHLSRLGRATQSELAQATAQHPAGVSRTLDELERRGLVARERDPADRRRVQVRLSDEGRAHYARVNPLVAEGNAEALAGLSRKEQEQLRALLRKMLG